MKQIVIPYIFAWLWVTSAFAVPQASAPGPGKPSRTAASPQSAIPAPPRPSPTPAPTPAPLISSAPVANGPRYSPGQMDFGAVDFSASSRRTFSMTPSVAGEITLEFPAGSFVLAELRRVPPLELGKARAQMQRSIVPPMKPAPVSNNGTTELYKWNFVAGEEMQLDILFAPEFSKDKTPGLRSATMKLSGMGAITPWAVQIPMRGAVNSPKLDLSPQPPTRLGAGQQSSTMNPTNPASSQSKQAAVGTMYKDALGRPNSGQSSASTSTNAASQTTTGLGPSSAVAKGGTQTDYKRVLGRSAGESPAATASSQVAVRPTPTPIPPLSPPPSTAFVDNAPQHSPDQFDFGEVWDGDFAKQTLSLTTNAAGYVTIKIPNGPFRVGEFREIGGVIGLKSKNSGKLVNIAAPEIKSRIVYQDGQSGPFQWSMAPGAAMQVDIYFQPHFQFGGMMAGLKSQTMKVTGPGPKGNWALSIPLRGMFDGLKVTAPIVPVNKEVYAIRGDSKAMLILSIAGLGTPVQGTIKAGQQVPQGVSVVAKNVTVPAGQTMMAPVQLSLSQFPDDGVPHPLELVFETAKGSSKTQLQFIGVSATGFDVNSGDRHDCSVSRISLSLSISSPQPAKDGNRTVRIIWVNEGWNYDLIKRHYVWMVAESGGVRIFDRVMVMPENHPDQVFENSAGFGGGAPGSLKISAEQWAQIVKGPFRFGCQESENLGNPKPENPKWGPAFKGSKI